MAGIATDGFNANVSFNSSLGGLQPAFCSERLPPKLRAPAFINSLT